MHEPDSLDRCADAGINPGINLRTTWENSGDLAGLELMLGGSCWIPS